MTLAHNAKKATHFSDGLKRVLHSSSINLTTEDGTTVLHDKETCFVITDMPSSSIVVKLETIGHLNTLDGRNWKKKCDYLIAIAYDDHVQVILLETKKTLRSDSKPREQVRRSIPILKYLVSLCEIEYERSWNIVECFSVIAEKEAERFDKQPTHVGPDPLSRSERYKEIDINFIIGTNLSFSSLTSSARR